MLSVAGTELSNSMKILNLLYKERELTKLEIARRLGVSVPTVITNVNELISQGLVEEAGVADSTGGRKPVIISFKPNSRFSFGVDFGTDQVRVVLTNLDCNILAEVSLPISGNQTIEETATQVSNEVNRIIENQSISKEQILGVGISLPGTVDEEQLILETAPNLKVKNVKFDAIFEKFNFPLYIENEANAAAYAESSLGLSREISNLVYVSITKGIGTGIIIKDHLYKGKNKRAGEFGHMTVMANGKDCNCGKKGCWELYASERALLEIYNKNKKASITEISEIFTDELSIDVLDEYLSYLAIGIQNIILLLDPDYVVLGGSIAKYESKLLEPLKEKVFVENNFFKQNDATILFSKLKENASILGAALLPMRTLFYHSDKII